MPIRDREYELLQRAGPALIHVLFPGAEKGDLYPLVRLQESIESTRVQRERVVGLTVEGVAVEWIERHGNRRAPVDYEISSRITPSEVLQSLFLDAERAIAREQSRESLVSQLEDRLRTS